MPRSWQTVAARRTGDECDSVVEVKIAWHVYTIARRRISAAHPSLRIEGRAEAVGTSLCDRRLASDRLSHLESLEFGMFQIEWPGRFVAGARVRSAELLRLGPRLEGGLVLRRPVESTGD
jgi:hypothetical protein